MFGWMRRVVAVLFVVGLAIGVVLLWPRSEPEEPSNSLAEATTTSTSLAGTTSTSDGPPTSASSGEDGRVVETVEEAEEILRELWFGWFEGIYNQDEDRIREVVILEETVETARERFGTEFERAPLPGDITFENTEILRTDDECLVLDTVLVTSGFREGSSRAVELLRWTSTGWKSLSNWDDRDDLWEADCESSLPS